MCKVHSDVQEHIFWILGNGMVSFWFDNWIGEQTLSQITNSPYIGFESVNYYWLDGTWDKHKLDRVVPPNISEMICNIPILQAADDIIKWKPTHDGVYSQSAQHGTLFVKRELISHTNDICRMILSWKSSSAFSHATPHIRSILPILILWFLWTERNDSKHRNMSFNAKRIIWRVHNYLWGLQVCKQNGRKWWREDHHVATQLGLKIQRSEPEKKITIVRWRKPNNQGFKLNTNGASKGSTGLAGAGGIIRDDRGHTVVAFQEFLGIATNTYAEISAVAKGLEIAHNRGLNDIWVEMDSKVGIALIKEKYTGHWKVQHLLAKIRYLCSLMTVSFSHIFREGNTVADFFANKAVMEKSSQIFSPEQLDRKAKGLISLDRFDLPNIRIG
ncbi:UNVERIFIED_CONTAM: hypothetical protein Sradi_4887100 [Sesamum radiatum]|uniref:RNase H type-1 domain-containing protein n=1 Tax=Sesamum radiatum TaxID=300843 RepID=A0AAW2MDU0_SESRA